VFLKILGMMSLIKRTLFATETRFNGAGFFF